MSSLMSLEISNVQTHFHHPADKELMRKNFFHEWTKHTETLYTWMK